MGALDFALTLASGIKTNEAKMTIVNMNTKSLLLPLIINLETHSDKRVLKKRASCKDSSGWATVSERFLKNESTSFHVGKQA